MNPHPEMVNRLGFEAWADNLIASTLEGADESFQSSWTENDDLVLLIRIEDGMVHATVRAFVKGQGWFYHDRTFKHGKA